MTTDQYDHQTETKFRSSKTRSRFDPNALTLYLSGVLLSVVFLALIPAHPIRVPTAIGSGFAIAMILYTILLR